MLVRSVLDLRKWVAEQIGQLSDSEDVDVVVRYVRRKTDHPLYGTDWSKFLETIDCRQINTSG